MQVRNCLAAIEAIIDDDAVTVFRQADFVRNLSSFQQQMSQDFCILRPGFPNAGNQLSGEDQNVSGSLGMDIANSDDQIIFIDDCCRDFASGDFFKKCFAHTNLNIDFSSPLALRGRLPTPSLIQMLAGNYSTSNAHSFLPVS